jgi:hypothetical protein
MWKSKKFIIVAAIIGVVLVGALAGVALAQTNSDGSPTTPGKTLIARVATILGLDQQKVEDAFKQAKQDMENEALNARLKAMVDSGKITQKQADDYENWWQSRPQDVMPGLGPRVFGRGGFGMRWRQFPNQAPATQ